MKQLSKALQKIKKLIFSLRVRYSQIYQKNIPKDKKLFLGNKSYTEWDYESKKCPKCKVGIIGESDEGVSILAD